MATKFDLATARWWSTACSALGPAGFDAPAAAAAVRRFPVWTIIRRAWWALLILVHIPALISSARALATGHGAAQTLTSAALALTVLVFFLKLLDVPWLRFRRRRGAVLAFLLACAMAHHEVAISDAGSAIIEQTPAALVTAALMDCLRRARRHLPDLERRLAAVMADPLVGARLCGTVLAWVAGPPPSPRVCTLGVPRGPPG